jgi:hypothetical protein
MRIISAILGFLVLGLSPSFVDWQETPEKRGQILMFYVVGALLITFGFYKK